MSITIESDRLGVARVTLNRPEVHNAFNAAMRDALVEALNVAQLDWSVGTVEVTGDGPSFCSGGDLGEFGTADDPVRAHLVRTTRSVAASIAFRSLGLRTFRAVRSAWHCCSNTTT